MNLTNLGYVTRNLAHEALERELANEKFGGLLVAPDLAKSDNSWAESVGARALGHLDAVRHLHGRFLLKMNISIVCRPIVRVRTDKRTNALCES